MTETLKLVRGSSEVDARHQWEKFVAANPGPYHVFHQDEFLREDTDLLCSAPAEAIAVSDLALRDYPGMFEDAHLCSNCVAILAAGGRR